MGDGDGPGKQRLGTGQPHGEVRTVPLHPREEALPVIAGARQIPALHHATEVGDAVFHWLDTTVASGIQHELRGAGQLSGLRGSEAVIHFEGDPLLRITGAGVAAEIVFTGGEKGGGGFAGGAVIESSSPSSGCGTAERLHAATLLDADSRGDGPCDEGCIQRLARERSCGKWQRSLGGAPGGGEANVAYGHGAQGGDIDAERMQILKGLAAQELSADFMARSGLAFNQGDAAPFAGEFDGNGAACDSSTED